MWNASRTICAALLGLAVSAAAKAETVLRVVPQADLKILDPIWTTAQLTQAHGLLVYDQLFATDKAFRPKPQMVDTWSTSADTLTWTFKLRPDLKFSDGSPVTSKDVAPSIKRWAARTTDGQILLKAIAGIDAVDPATFAIRLSRPYPMLLETLANPTTPLFIMREKEASTDPFTQVTEVVGSGPFMFMKDEFRPGSLVVYRKSPTYVPRSDPSDGMAGAKLAKVDRVEWRILPDITVAANALASGEVDVLENAPYDLIPVLAANPAVALTVIDPLGQQGLARMNTLIPPFNNPKVRQAVMLAVDRQEYLNAMVGNPKYETPCVSVFICGTASETQAGAAPYAKPNLDAARKLLQEAGYKGEKVVVMDPADYTVIHAMTLVTADRLKAIGMTVDLQTMDWSTLVSRRSIKVGPAENPGAWNVFHTITPSVGMMNPITNLGLGTACDGKNWFGWPCDEAMEKLRLSYLDAKSAEEQKIVLDQLQARFWDVVPFVQLGQLTKPIAHRATVSGFVQSPILAVWNVEKK